MKWKNTSLAGNDTNTLDVEAITSSDGMEFRCVVNDSYENKLVSDSVYITLNAEWLKLYSVEFDGEWWKIRR